MEKIYKIQEKYVERDYNNPQLESEMLEYTWKEAQKELLDKIIQEYSKEEEISHFGLKLLKFREELSEE